MSLIDKVMAAKVATEAKFASQVSNGIPLSDAQNTEILIAQVQAILGGETISIQPATEAEQ
jgi:hypothetical protein